MAHPVVHFEIGCKDKAKLSEFYGEVFGWKIDPGPMGMIDTGSDRRYSGPHRGSGARAASVHALLH